TGGTIRIGKTVNQAQQPFGDISHYEAVQFKNPFIISGPDLKSLSLYIGSLDTYNSITFLGAGGFSQTINGTALGAPANGNITDPATNRQFFFKFDAGDQVNHIIFTTTQPAFEFDNIYAAVSSVPEPATWTMLIIGFGSIGFMLRRQREMVAFASL
ncbi:MAG TPA: PEPxxWA-CTERM sorting domain-containing protein, partial [Rhizomicrobium sp.]